MERGLSPSGIGEGTIPGVPPSKGGSQRRPRYHPYLAVGVAAVVVLAGLGLTYYLTNREPASHESCALGGPIATERLLTPVLVVNAPYNGTASTYLALSLGPNYTFGSGGLQMTTRASPPPLAGGEGETTGNMYGRFYPNSLPYTPANWTVYAVRNVTTRSAGPTQPCSSPFIAAAVGILQSGQTNYLLSVPQNTSDIGEATEPILPASGSSGYPGVTGFVQVYVSFHDSNYATVDDCSTPGTTLSYAGQARIPIGVPFPYQGQNRTVLGEMSWQNNVPTSPTLSYTFPGYAGIWQIDSLAGNDTEGFLSFSYLPCPSG